MQDLLTKFGEQFTKNVRDYTIEDVERIVKGKSKAPCDQNLQKELAQFDEKEKKIIQKLILLTVDSSLHNLLWFFEQSEDFDICTLNDVGANFYLSAESDGLAGELYTEDGWIEQFSKHEKSI